MRLSMESYERMAGEVLKVYEQAEIEMLRRVTNRLKRGVDQPGWTEKHYGEMKAVSAEMTKVVDELHNGVNRMQQEYVDTAYADGKDSFINEAKQFTDLSGITHLTPNAIKVANIMGDLDLSMSAADRLILRQVNDAYANIIAETAGLVATGSYTNRQAVQTAVNRFADRGITSFVDKAGRHWDMTTYAEMATLTAIERATRQGYTDTMQEYGFDLAIISSHYGACPLCEAWENVIISISGRDARYPSLADAEGGGCFHPRCLHDFNTYFEGITEGGRKGPREVITENVGYAARAQLRAYERSERQWKRRMAVAQSPEEERKAYARVRMYQDRIRTLVDEYNSTQIAEIDRLNRQYYREGGRVKLTAEAAKLKPYKIPIEMQARPVDLFDLVTKSVPNPRTDSKFFGLQSIGERWQFRSISAQSARDIVSNYEITQVNDSKRRIREYYAFLDSTQGYTVEWTDDGQVEKYHSSKEAMEKLHALSDTLTERMVVRDSYAAEDYKAYSTFLRETPVFVDSTIRADIPDFHDYARSSANHIRTSKDPKNISVDSLYEEWSAQRPDYFPPEIANPSEQFERINEVVSGLKEQSSRYMRDAYGPDEMKELRDTVEVELLRNYLVTSYKARESIGNGKRRK